MNTTSMGRLWQRSLAELGASDMDLLVWKTLLQYYRQEHRHYHSVQHVAECLQLAQQYRAMLQNPAQLCLALLFHDAIYDVMKGDNEQRSADWAAQVLSKIGVSKSDVARIVRLILITRHDQKKRSSDQRFIADIDLAILGTEMERYWQYVYQVREEYRQFSDQQFYGGRQKMLDYFLGRRHIYATSVFRQRLEKPARCNLSAERAWIATWLKQQAKKPVMGR